MKIKKILIYWRPILLFLLAGFLIGAVHAVKDNMSEKDDAEIVKGISDNLSINFLNKKAYIVYNCKGHDGIAITFDSLLLTKSIGFEFSNTDETKIPFISFDRIYTTVGSGLLLSWGIKDIYQASVTSKSKGKILLIALGAISGYSLGYKLFKVNKIDCSSNKIEHFFQNKEKLIYLKKCILTQIMLSNVLVKKVTSSELPKCYSLGKTMIYDYRPDGQLFRNILDPTTVLIPEFQTIFFNDKTLFEKAKMIEGAYYNSYQKLREDKFIDFSSQDLINFINHIEFFKEIVQKASNTQESISSEYTIKKIETLSDSEEKALW